MSRIYVPVAFRQVVLKRACERCEYCQAPLALSPQIFKFEHIQPLAAGGATELSNLALACPSCNRYKGARQTTTDPATEQVVQLFNPRRDRWDHHFQWSGDLSSINGLTPEGRGAVAALRINRPVMQRFRLALAAIGQHPNQ